jgi:hypothetical protein
LESEGNFSFKKKKKKKNSNKFERGKTDLFEIKEADIGDLRKIK